MLLHILPPATLPAMPVKKYLKTLKQRRTDEMEMLTYLTGKSYSDWDVVMNEEEKSVPAEAEYVTVSKDINKKPGRDNVLLFATIGVIGLVSLAGLRKYS